MNVRYAFLRLSAVFAVSLIFSLNGNGGTPPPDLLDKLRARYPETSFISVNASPISGVFEVVMQNSTAYTDAAARYFLPGPLIDMGGPVRNAARTPSVTPTERRIDYASLPRGADIIYETSEEPVAEVAYFSDLGCPYCRMLEQQLNLVHGVRVRVYLYPLSGEYTPSGMAAQALWCSRNRTVLYRRVMLGTADVPAGPVGGCASPIADNIALGRRLGIVATPTLIAPNGSVLLGFAPKERLHAWIFDNQFPRGNGNGRAIP